MTIFICVFIAAFVCFYKWINMHFFLRYLQSEWEVRRGSSRDFSSDQTQSSHCIVPLQDNSSDCGLYLLQYVESFLKVKKLAASLFMWLKYREMFYRDIGSKTTLTFQV